MLNIVLMIIVPLLTLFGIFFLTVGTIGLLRFPDIFTRMHATSKCDTLGTALVLIALAFAIGTFVESFKLIVMIAFIWTINPIVAHSIGKTEYQRGTLFTQGSFFRDCYNRTYPGMDMLRRDKSHDA